MRARATIFGHSVHQVLIVFPLGLFWTSVIFDLIGILRKDPKFFEVTVYLLGAGIVSAFIAMIFGIADYAAVRDNTRAARVGLLHAAVNIVALACFILSFVLRTPPAALTMTPLVMSLLGGTLLLISSWLGGELVSRLGVGVDRGANQQAPSSLERVRIPLRDRRAGHPS